MKVAVKNEMVELQKKQRNIGDEAPAVKLTMLSGEEKVVGMMSDRVQVIFTLPYSHSLNGDINRVIHKYREKVHAYLISSDEFAYGVNKNYSSMDFENFALKYGVYINSEVCAKSLFIIDKEGEIVFKRVMEDLKTEFDVEEFDKELQNAVDFKRKGHAHENWMSA